MSVMFRRTARVKPYRDQNAKFPAPFQNVAQHHDSEAGAAEQEAQPSKDLKRAQIGILHGIKSI